MNRNAPIVRVARGAPGAASLPGSPTPAALPEAERRYHESVLQHDFSEVRLHTGAGAAASAAALGARAFTDGGDIAFAAGRYQPGTPAGRELLAHELVHVAQQSRGGSGSGAEARAQQAAAKAVRGAPVKASEQGGAGHGVQCDDDDKKEAPVAPATAPSFGTLRLPPLGASLPRSFGSPRLGDSLHAPFILPAPTLSAPFSAPALSLTPPLSLPLGGMPAGPAGVGPGALQPLTAPQLPFSKMQNAELLAPFALHGVTPGTLRINIHSDWSGAYQMFRGYMPEGMAVMSANMFLASAYQAMLERDYPSAMDIEQRRYKAAHPDETAIPPIPIVSSSSLTTLYEWITNKKNTNAFYF